jgi:hypothetical protein
VATVDGREGRQYDEIDWIHVSMSRDGRRVAYSAKRSGKQIVVIDGKEVTGPDGADSPCVSPDGRHAAYCAKDGAVERAVVDGKKGPPYETIHSLAYSSDSRRLGYVGKRDGKAHAVIDAVESPAYDDVKTLVFSPDGTRAAYVAERAGKSLVVVDGVEGPEYDTVTSLLLMSTVNMMTTDSTLGLLDKYRFASALMFSPDGTRLAYMAQRGAKWMVVTDGVEGPPFDEVKAPVFSDDSRHLAYAAQRDGQWRVVADGQEGSAYSQTGLPVFSAGARHLAYSALDRGQPVLVMDGKGKGTYDGLADRPVFSANGERIACVGLRGSPGLSTSRDSAQYVEVDGVKVEGEDEPSYAQISTESIVFSKDSRHVAYAAKTPRPFGGKWVVVLDGVPGPECDCLGQTRATFLPDGTLQYLAVRDRTMVRVRLVPAR